MHLWLSCRLPLPTLFYRLEAVHLGNLLRIKVRSGTKITLFPLRVDWEAQDSAAFRSTYPFFQAIWFQGVSSMQRKEDQCLPESNRVGTYIADFPEAYSFRPCSSSACTMPASRAMSIIHKPQTLPIWVEQSKNIPCRLSWNILPALAVPLLVPGTCFTCYFYI